MTFNWREYFNLAQELTAQAKGNTDRDEAKLRCAISRAYYATYCKARNVLRDKDGISVPSIDAHKFVIDKFANSTVMQRQQIGADLLRLKDNRKRADYNDDLPRIDKVIHAVLLTAQTTLDEIDKL